MPIKDQRMLLLGLRWHLMRNQSFWVPREYILEIHKSIKNKKLKIIILLISSKLDNKIHDKNKRKKKFTVSYTVIKF